MTIQTKQTKDKIIDILCNNQISFGICLDNYIHLYDNQCELIKEIAVNATISCLSKSSIPPKKLRKKYINIFIDDEHAKGAYICLDSYLKMPRSYKFDNFCKFMFKHNLNMDVILIAKDDVIKIIQNYKNYCNNTILTRSKNSIRIRESAETLYNNLLEYYKI